LLKSTEINNVVVGKIRSIKVTGTSCREQCPLFVGFVETLSARYCNKKKKCSEETGDKKGNKKRSIMPPRKSQNVDVLYWLLNNNLGADRGK
jgi:hypothetical protein